MRITPVQLASTAYACARAYVLLAVSTHVACVDACVARDNRAREPAAYAADLSVLVPVGSHVAAELETQLWVGKSLNMHVSSSILRQYFTRSDVSWLPLIECVHLGNACHHTPCVSSACIKL